MINIQAIQCITNINDSVNSLNKIIHNLYSKKQGTKNEEWYDRNIGSK
jgi:hypothetical protein